MTGRLSLIKDFNGEYHYRMRPALLKKLMTYASAINALELPLETFLNEAIVFYLSQRLLPSEYPKEPSIEDYIFPSFRCLLLNHYKIHFRNKSYVLKFVHTYQPFEQQLRENIQANLNDCEIEIFINYEMFKAAFEGLWSQKFKNAKDLHRATFLFDLKNQPFWQENTREDKNG